MLKNQQKLIAKILKLKKEKNAVILAHNYQNPEIFAVADFIGDSLDLSRKAASTKADIIVFCGVDFMAETAKILSPDKIILLPCRTATCPMAKMVDSDSLKTLMNKHPKAAVVAYVNSTTEIKALANVCVTSANAIKVVDSLKENEVIFVPDRNLAAYVANNTTKTIIPWDGYCCVHDGIDSNTISLAQSEYPDAEVIAHPECRQEVLALANRICSTSQMITAANESKAKSFLIATEEGMLNVLKSKVPDKTFIGLGRICQNMKKNSLELVYEALQKGQHEIIVNKEVAIKAKLALSRMLEIA